MNITASGARFPVRLMGRLAVLAGLVVCTACALIPAQDARPGAEAPAAPIAVHAEPSAAEIRAREAKMREAPGAAALPEESLLNTYWKLVTLRGAPVVAGEQQREPHLILHREGNRVSAHGGCNRLAGGYTLAGQRLAFGPLVGTRMACRGGFQDEAGFAAALEASASWRIDGQYLELYDQAGERLARFEVRHL